MWYHVPSCSVARKRYCTMCALCTGSLLTFFYPKSIFAIYEWPLINVVQYVWCEVGSACLRIGPFLYRDLILFLIFGNLILTAIITCMVLPRLSSRRWRWWAPWCSSWRATRSQSSTAFETGAHAESPPVDPVISDNDDDIDDEYMPQQVWSPKASLKRLRDIEEEMA